MGQIYSRGFHSGMTNGAGTAQFAVAGRSRIALLCAPTACDTVSRRNYWISKETPDLYHRLYVLCNAVTLE